MHRVVKPLQNEPICKLFLEQSKCFFSREPLNATQKQCCLKRQIKLLIRGLCRIKIVGVWLMYRRGKLHWRVHNLHCFILVALVCRWKRQSGWVLFSVSSGLTYQPPYCKHFISSSCRKLLRVACCLGFNLKGKASRRAAFCLSPASSSVDRPILSSNSAFFFFFREGAGVIQPFEKVKPAFFIYLIYLFF